MPDISADQIRKALTLAEFDDWQTDIDVKNLNRPRQRPAELEGTGRVGAVLLLLFTELDRTKIVLTRRCEKLSHHAGQISLPGGRVDPGETTQQTALRETHEEIGVPPTNIEILGKLNQVYIPPSDFTVTPYVGWFEGLPNFTPSENEVAEVITTSIGHLLDPATLSNGAINVDDRQLNVPFYNVDDHRVWGATAIILREFLLRTSVVLGINE